MDGMRVFYRRDKTWGQQLYFDSKFYPNYGTDHLLVDGREVPKHEKDYLDMIIWLGASKIKLSDAMVGSVISMAEGEQLRVVTETSSFGVTTYPLYPNGVFGEKRKLDFRVDPDPYVWDLGLADGQRRSWDVFEGNHSLVDTRQTEFRVAPLGGGDYAMQIRPYGHNLGAEPAMVVHMPQGSGHQLENLRTMAEAMYNNFEFGDANPNDFNESPWPVNMLSLEV